MFAGCVKLTIYNSVIVKFDIELMTVKIFMND